jgi:RES domain-containing protein
MARKVTIWRIVHQDWSAHAYTGEGAKRYGGRFNSPGRAVVYASWCLSLALLEQLVQRGDRRRFQHYVCVPATLDERLVEEAADLPEGWDSRPVRRVSQVWGDAWLAGGRRLALRVPSVVVPQESNYLINPLHQDFPKVEIGEPFSVPFDKRLVP